MATPESAGSFSAAGSLPRRRSVVQDALQQAQDRRSLVQVELQSRAVKLELAAERGQLVVRAFAHPEGEAEAEARVMPSDLLVAVGDHAGPFASAEDALEAIQDAELPVVLVFRRSAPRKPTLGEYSVQEIERQLLLNDSTLLDTRSTYEAAQLIRACVEACGDKDVALPLSSYVTRLEQHELAEIGWSDRHDENHQRLESVKQLMKSLHESISTRKKEQLAKWNADKAAQLKRIEVVERQLSNIKSKLAKMRERRGELHPDNTDLWKEYIELRHLSGQLDETVESAKQQHYLPVFEGYSLRFGSDGIYIGIGDIWIPSFHAKFTIETRSTAPHMSFHLSTPSSHGLKLRIANFKLATEGRLPSFHCDELNVEAQLIADIPLNFDHVSGWQVPQEGLEVKLMSFLYYERQANSTKRGTDHDTIMRMFINRMLPTIVRHAVQALLCIELGPLIERRDAQVILTGDIRLRGKPLAVYDAPLCVLNPASGTFLSSPSINKSATKDHDVSEMAREMLGLSTDEAEALGSVFNMFVEPRNPSKMSLFAKPEIPRFCIRNLIGYFSQFDNEPHLKSLACELWGQSVQLLTPTATPRSRFVDTSVPFSLIVDTLERIKEYPVDLSVSVVDMTVRLDLCEAGATLYTTLQRIIRQKMDSTSVGLSNFQDLRDGTYLENKLSRLDRQFTNWNRFLAHVTSNVDELGAIFRGGFRSGILSKMLLEMHDLAAKGPCGGSITIPLTDLGGLVSPDGLQIPKPKKKSTDDDDIILTRTYENESLVLSRFLRTALQTTGTDLAQPNNADEILPHNRLKVSVKNTAARILFEVPSDLSRLTPGEALVPFALSVVTDEPDSPPLVRIETGEFAKCQYKAERIAVSGHADQFITKAEEMIGEDGEASSPAAKDNNSSGSFWDEYVESPFFSVKFHFFTSCQVTSEHLYWSLRSASLAEPKVFQVKHRLSVAQFLVDLAMVSVVDDSASATHGSRQINARMRRALRQQSSTGHPGRSSLSNISETKTLFSRTSFVETLDGYSEFASEADSRSTLSQRRPSVSTANPEAVAEPNAIHVVTQALQEELHPPLPVVVPSSSSPSPPPSPPLVAPSSLQAPPLGSKSGSAMFF